MKKYFKFLIIPLFALVLLCGCGGDYKVTDIQKAYENMKTTMVIDGENNFFTDAENSYAIKIAYSTQVQNAINNSSASNEVQKRYRALYYQQAILDAIFDFYNNYQEEFYRIAPSKSIESDEVESLYNRVNELKTVLYDFNSHYLTFVTATENGTSDIMAFNITSYSFQLNSVIDASFNFINEFYNMYVNYCVDDFTIYNEHNLNMFVDKAYLDIAQIVYLENIKSFNYAVGNNGICDLSYVVGSNSTFNLLDLLDSRKSISTAISENVGLTTEQGKIAENKLNLFTYQRDIFNQRVGNYTKTYNSLDMYEVNQYRFKLNGTVDYDSYLISLSMSNKATLTMLDNFINDTFKPYTAKLMTIVQ